MPLRPVSELGLVDITDVPGRDGTRTASRRRSAPTSRSPSRPPRDNSRDDHQTSTRSDRSEGARASTPKLARKAQAPAVDSTGKSNRARSNTSARPSETSKRRSARGPKSAPSARNEQSKVRSGAATRSATARSPKRSNSSTAAPRRATPVRQRTSGGTRIKSNPASRDTQRSRGAQRAVPMKPLSAAKIGISVLLAATLVTGGLLFARAALHR